MQSMISKSRLTSVFLKDEMKKNNDFCNLDLHYWMGKPGYMPWSEASKLYVY